VIISNSEYGDGLYYEILRVLALEFDWPGYRPIEKEIVPLGPEAMTDSAGKYLLEGKVALTIHVEGDPLRMEARSNHYRLFPESASKFFDIDLGDHRST